MTSKAWLLADEAATASFAHALAQALPDTFMYIALSGELGAGKTHLVRCLLRALGETGPVRSPTYTLMEDYPAAHRVVHMDLYRLADASEMENLGLRELLGESLCLCVEWAERAGAYLPRPNLQLRLKIVGPTARHLQIEALGQVGAACLANLVEISPVPPVS